MPKQSHRATAKKRTPSKKRKSKRNAQVTFQGYIPTHADDDNQSIPSAVAIPHREQQAMPQYGYVVTELKRIGIIAGVMIIVLIILSQVL